jgi:hypothetical protein
MIRKGSFGRCAPLSGHLSMRRPPAQNDSEQTPARARDGK